MDQRRALVTPYRDKKEVALSWLLEATGLSRNAWYYQSSVDITKEKPIIEAIKDVLTVSPYYGYRRVTAELKRQDQNYNHKRILRIMGENYLIQVSRKRSVPRTTNSNHQYLVYANEIKLLTNLVPATVWVADITYIPVGDTWCYAAIVLDQCTRKVVGWSVASHMRTALCIEALTMALTNHSAPRFHHSDRGGQYCRVRA